MTDKYDSNSGDYSSYTDNFKRQTMVDVKSVECLDGDLDESSQVNSTKAGDYVRELLAEKLSIDHVKQPNVARLIDQGMYYLCIGLSES